MEGGLERQKTLRSLIRDEHLTCAICFGVFMQPKALPCLHTFCANCLRDYITGRNYESEGVFPCPMCRKDTTIPVGGVAGFPDNYHVANLTDTIETESNKPSIPPRPSPAAIDTARQQYEGSNPYPNPVQPAEAQPTPQYLPVPNSGYQPGAGAWGDQGYVKPGLQPESPFEYVNQQGDVSGVTYTHNLYPHLVDPDTVKGPCMDKVVLTFGNFGAEVKDFRKPFDIAVGRNGEFVVSDQAGNRIFIFTNLGERKAAFYADKCNVNGLAITKDNNILVAVTKSGSAIMRLYSMQGKLLKSIGDFFAYDHASGITLTPSNFVAVTNLASDNVLVFTDQFKSSVKFGRKGRGDNHFLQPKFIAATMKNYLVISDTGNHCVKICDSEGNTKRSFGGVGQEHGKLDTPLGIATDQEDNIIIADSNNFRVEIYTVKGMFLTTLVQDTNRIGPDVKPIAVAVTPRNNVAVLLFGTGFAEIRVYNWRSMGASRYGISTV